MAIIILFTLAVSLYLSKKRDAELVEYCKNIVLKMTGNTHFPTLQTETTALGVLVSDFATALNNANHGPSGSVAAKNKTRKILELATKTLAANCLGIAGSDVAIYETSGFTLRKTPVKHDFLDFPTGFDATSTLTKGRVKIKFKAPEGSKNCMVAYNKVGDAEFKTKFLSNGKSTYLTGLESGKVYEFKIKALGKDDVQSDWSGIVTCSVL